MTKGSANKKIANAVITPAIGPVKKIARESWEMICFV